MVLLLGFYWFFISFWVYVFPLLCLLFVSFVSYCSSSWTYCTFHFFFLINISSLIPYQKKKKKKRDLTVPPFNRLLIVKFNHFNFILFVLMLWIFIGFPISNLVVESYQITLYLVRYGFLSAIHEAQYA